MGSYTEHARNLDLADSEWKYQPLLLQLQGQEKLQRHLQQTNLLFTRTSFVLGVMFSKRHKDMLIGAETKAYHNVLGGLYDRFTTTAAMHSQQGIIRLADFLSSIPMQFDQSSRTPSRIS